MIRKIRNLFYRIAISGIAVLSLACGSKPKVIEGESVETMNRTLEQPSFHEPAEIPEAQLQHTVVVIEVLNNDKYSYVNVTEGQEKFWVVIPRKEVTIGKTYYYEGGILKVNFESKEFDRVFERLYLVSDLIPHPLNMTREYISENLPSTGESTQEAVNGSVLISKIYANPDDYSGKTIVVTGKCTKVNPMIMNRNWVHIDDGSTGGRDLTVTTTDIVRVGMMVSLEGTINLDKDFGAGYRYDVIMENAVIR